MIYSSLLFVYLFFPFSLLIYFISPEKYRNASLLFLSILFCVMNGAGYLLFMAVYTAMNFYACRLIGKYRKNKGIAKSILILALVLNISVIFIFRSDFFSVYRELLLIPKEFFPVGISFFTLSAVGTLADVYSGKILPEKNIVYFALYIMFFPRLIMGPPMRYSYFRKMLRSRTSDLAGIGTGISLFVKGFAKKVLAADTLFALYNAASGVDIEKMPALTAWLGAVSYLLCLYYTISGFSDMSAGISCCFGFRMTKSFNYPVLSPDVRSFTARWHMQILQWFSRYISRPLSALTEKKMYKDIIILAVGGLFGFWYTFETSSAVAGIIWSAAVLIETRYIKEKQLQVTGMLYTFVIAVVCAVFIAGDSVSYSMKYILAMIGGNRSFADSQSLYLFRSYILVLLVCMYAATNFFRNIMMRSGRRKLQKIITAVSPLIVLSAMVLCTMLISYRGSSEMILLKM